MYLRHIATRTGEGARTHFCSFLDQKASHYSNLRHHAHTLLNQGINVYLQREAGYLLSDDDNDRSYKFFRDQYVPEMILNLTSQLSLIIGTKDWSFLYVPMQKIRLLKVKNLSKIKSPKNARTGIQIRVCQIPNSTFF